MQADLLSWVPRAGGKSVTAIKIDSELQYNHLIHVVVSLRDVMLASDSDGSGIGVMVSTAEWIVHQNIKRFEGLIESEANPDKRAQLEAMLEEERAKMTAHLPSGEE